MGDQEPNTPNIEDHLQDTDMGKAAYQAIQDRIAQDANPKPVVKVMGRPGSGVAPAPLETFTADTVEPPPTEDTQETGTVKPISEDSTLLNRDKNMKPLIAPPAGVEPPPVPGLELHHPAMDEPPTPVPPSEPSDIG